MPKEGSRVCQCRRCRGVFNGAHAVQYVWESVFGSCAVPVVAGVYALTDGFVRAGWVYWRDEPDGPFPLADLHAFVVSCRPGRGTIPSEGDIGRWHGWVASGIPPRDWLLVDGLTFRSVSQVAHALRDRSRMPCEQIIPGDWWGADAKEHAERRAIREQWTQTKQRNRATSRI
ncbi:MAG: hypothetical protein WD598_09135 [Acidimicrobiia bacterium]